MNAARRSGGWAVWLAIGLSCFAVRCSAAEPVGVKFVATDPRLQEHLDRCVATELARARTFALKSDQIAVSLVDLSSPSPSLAGYRAEEPIYPASVVKVFYLAATHQWLEDGRLQDSAELRRARRDMIVDSYNEATHYVVDVLTGTTSGPELAPDALQAWWEQRNAVNRWYASLGYPSTLNVNKKPWCEGPYGREKQAMEVYSPARNFLTVAATARLFTEIARDGIVTADRCAQMRELLQRDPWAKPVPEDQITGFIANGLPHGAKLWSKAGWTSQVRHDAALIELPGGRRLVLVIFTTDHAGELDILPNLTRSILAGLP